MTLEAPPDAPRLDVASEHATRQVPVFAPDVTVGGARDALVGCRYESAIDIAVCEHGRLVGLVTIEQLLAADAGATLAGIMDADPPVIAPGADQEIAAWKAVQAGESSLAVVDADGGFRGLVPPRRLLGVLLHEHAEDLARLGGFLQDAAAARASSAEPVVSRFWHRVPWLVIGLAGAMAAAGIVASFESLLRSEVLLAFFVPGVVYMADAVGTQTEALVIRGLSVGVPIAAVVRQELLTGVAVGMFMSVGFLVPALLAWGDLAVAVTVCVALFVSCCAATLIAMVLPWLLHRLGRDPAFGSGPLATVIQDLLSITVYFAIASAIVT